jgi:multidrug efflux pump
VSISSPFIRRPVGTSLLIAAIVLSGVIAFQFLPVGALPQVDFPTIRVRAALPGASPEIMASSVATPLERQFGRIAGVTEMTSSSYLGTTSITLQFDLNRNIDGAARDVQAAINAARSYLPTNLPSNPWYRKVNPADVSILIGALTSDEYGRGRLYDAASTVLAQGLSQIEGVGEVFVGGGALPGVRVDVNPTQLSSYGLGLPDIRNMLSVQNANIPKGEISNDRTQESILANDQLFKAAEYKPLIVGYHNGAAIQLSDVASVTDSVENIRAAAWAGGKPCVLLFIQRQPKANIIDTVDRIRAALPALEASIPPGIHFSTVMDRTLGIRASVSDAEYTLIISVGLAIFVVFVFLRNARVTLIPSIAVPASLVGTFGVMYLFGFSLDNLSLMALTISTGFLVDDAVVVIENITRHLEQGMRPMEAAFKGAQEIGFTVVSMSMSLIAVFIPILLMSGIVGRLFRELAVTLATAILLSLLISLTATPMLCSRLLQLESRQSHGFIYRINERIFNSLLRGYESSLRWVLRNAPFVLGLLILVVFVNIYLFVVIPKGFFPQQDNGTIQGGILGSEDASYQTMQRLTKQFVGILQSDPAVEHAMGYTGGGGATNQGSVWVGLKPLAERKISASDVIRRLRPKLMSVPGGAVYLQAGQDLRIGGRSSSAQFQYTLQGQNISDLVTWGPILLKQMRQMPQLTDVNSDQENRGLETYLTYDRDTAARLGITPQMIDNTLYEAFGQAQVSTMYTALNQYHVVMEVAPQFWQHPTELRDFYIRPSTGTEVPLNAIVHVASRTAPLAINHQGQFPSVTVSFNLAPGVALGTAATAIEDMEENMGLPPSIHEMFAGTAEAYQSSLSSEPLLIVTALLAVYIVLGMLYESYIHPITILSTLPSAGVGAILALMIFHSELSVVALIGIILLIGIVQKNAILMIDFAITAERFEAKTSREAIYQACSLRFRPILMTTMAALFGALPLALGTGMGSELRRPLGIAIVGGLIFSQLLTLYTTPVVYLYMDRFSKKRKRLPFAHALAQPSHGAAD